MIPATDAEAAVLTEEADVLVLPLVLLRLSNQSVLQVAKKVCRMWRVVLLVSTKYVHVACFTGPRLSQSFAASEVMFMVLRVLYNGFFSN